MKKIFTISLIITMTLLFASLASTSKTYAQEKNEKESVKINIKAKSGKTPRALIKLKEKNLFIEIQNLDLTPDETERLKKEIIDEIDIDDIPKGLDLKMNIKITKNMLEDSELWEKFKDLDLEDDNDEFSIDLNSEDGDAKVNFFKDMTVASGEKHEDVVVISGNLDFAGEADNVVVILGDAKLQPGAKIHDDFVVLFGDSDVHPEATVNGEQVTLEAGESVRDFLKILIIPGAIFSAWAITPVLILAKIMMWLILFGFSVLIFHVFPETKEKSKTYLKTNTVTSLGFGVLGLILAFVIALFLLLSIIGIPLLPLLTVLLFLMLFGGYALAAHYIGELIPLKRVKNKEIWSLFFGVIIIAIVSLIPVVGCLLKCLAITIGFGAVGFVVFEEVFKKRKKNNPPPAEVQQSSPDSKQ